MSAYNPTSMTRLRLQSSASVNSLPAQTITLLASEQHCISITAHPVNNSHRLLEPRGSVVRPRLDLHGDLRVATHRSLPLQIVFPKLGRVMALVLDLDHACGSAGSAMAGRQTLPSTSKSSPSRRVCIPMLAESGRASRVPCDAALCSRWMRCLAVNCQEQSVCRVIKHATLHSCIVVTGGGDDIPQDDGENQTSSTVRAACRRMGYGVAGL